MHVIAAATPIRDFATNTACKGPAKPTPPPSACPPPSKQPVTAQAAASTGGSSPDPGSNYWWLLLVAAAAGGLALAYQYDLFGTSKETISVAIPSSKKSKYDDDQSKHHSHLI